MSLILQGFMVKPLVIAPAKLKDIKVLQIIKEGKTIYQR